MENYWKVQEVAAAGALLPGKLVAQNKSSDESVRENASTERGEA